MSVKNCPYILHVDADAGYKLADIFEFFRLHAPKWLSLWKWDHEAQKEVEIRFGEEE